MLNKLETEIKLWGQYNNQLKYSNDSCEDSIKKIKLLLKRLDIHFFPPVQKQQVDTYYDTEDNRLLRMESSARVRRVDGEQVLITLKCAAENRNDAKLHTLARNEEERPLNLGENAEKAIKSLVKERLSVIGIQEQLTVHNTRSLIPIETETRRYELCFDKYYFYSRTQNRRSEDFYEIEIESDTQTISDDKQLSQLAGIFIDILGFVGNPSSKYRRGIEWCNSVPNYDNKQFIVFDIVKYSLRESYAQKEMIVKFGSLVGECLKEEGLDQDCLKIPTGDGMFLCLDERKRIIPLLVRLFRKVDRVNQNCQAEDRIVVRTALHDGPVFEYQDINNHRNYAGLGINMAARIISQADDHQILVSEELYKRLCDQDQTEKCNFSDKYTITVKHGVALEIRNFYDSYLKVGIPHGQNRL